MKEDWYLEWESEEEEENSTWCVRCGKVIEVPLLLCFDCHKKQEMEEERHSEEWFDLLCASVERKGREKDE